MKDFNKLKIILYCAFFIVVSCGNKTQINQDKNITKIEISYVDLTNYLTPYAIPCNYFSFQFEEYISKKIIINECQISQIEHFIEKSIKNNQKVDNVDVRFKMMVYYKNKNADTICGNGSVINFKGINYLIDKDFSIYLLNLTQN